MDMLILKNKVFEVLNANNLILELTTKSRLSRNNVHIVPNTVDKKGNFGTDWL